MAKWKGGSNATDEMAVWEGGRVVGSRMAKTDKDQSIWTWMRKGGNLTGLSLLWCKVSTYNSSDHFGHHSKEKDNSAMS